MADTRSAAMDLRCRLEHNERDWLREKAELLQRFDSERREWESQLRDMQGKIEKLYCEVRAKREGTGRENPAVGVAAWRDDNDVLLGLCSPCSAAASSARGGEPMDWSGRSSRSELPERLPGSYRRGDVEGTGGEDSGCNSPGFPGNAVYGEPSAGGRQQGAAVARGEEDPDAAAELDALLRVSSRCGTPRSCHGASAANVTKEEKAPRMELGYSSSRKRNTTALNAALKEIARVSEELCSYQEEVRWRADKGDKRNGPEPLREERKRVHDRPGKTGTDPEEPLCDLGQIYDDLRALERENWAFLSPRNTWQENGTEADSFTINCGLPDVDESAELLAPPVPPRSTSWNMSSPTHLEPELHIPETPVATARKCHSPCVLVDRLCNSPSIVRKFEAMLQENEGKVLTDCATVSCTAPANSNCNAGCCHNRWSCDMSKLASSKPTTCMPFQKSFSEVNIPTTGKDSNRAVCNVRCPEGPRIPQSVKELAVDLPLPSLEIPRSCSSLQSPRRNVLLEQKTAEFNRTLFQAEMGRGVADQDGSVLAEAAPIGSSAACHARCGVSEGVKLSRDTNSNPRPQSTGVTSDVISAISKVTQTAATCDTSPRSPEERLRKTSNDSCGQEVKVQPAVPCDLSLQQGKVTPIQVTMVTSQTLTRCSEVKQKSQTPNNPSGQKQHCTDTESPSSASVSTTTVQLTQSVTEARAKLERPNRQKLQSVKAGGSSEQPAGQTRPTLTSQAEPQGKHVGGVSATPSQTDLRSSAPRVMKDHPWKPLTLAAYPRPEGSRSNYGAVERILKSYGESAAWVKQSQAASAPDLSPKQGERAPELSETLDTDPAALPRAPRHTRYSHASHAHTTFAQLGSRSSVSVEETQLTIKDCEGPAISSSSPGSAPNKNFSRPACPANRRRPSRWASHSLSSSSSSSSFSSSSSSSPSSTPKATPPVPLQKHPSSFAFSHAFRMETFIV